MAALSPGRRRADSHEAPQHLSEIRIVLLGERRSGKSSSGNTILGRDEFDTEGVTEECVKRQGEVAGRQITVVDTPGYSSFPCIIRTDPQHVRQEVVRSVSLCPPGPHALLLVIPLITLREKQRRSVKEYLELLSERVWRHTIVPFTWGDELTDTTIEQHIERGGEELQWLVEKCGNRYHVLNNKNRGDRTQVTELLEKIEHMVAGNYGLYFTTDIKEINTELEKYIRQREEKRQRDRGAETEVGGETERDRGAETEGGGETERDRGAETEVGGGETERDRGAETEGGGETERDRGAETEVGGETERDRGAETEGGGETERDRGAETEVGGGETERDRGAETEGGGETERDRGAETEGGGETERNRGAETDGGGETERDRGAETEGGGETERDGGAETEGGGGTERDGGAETEGGGETERDEGAETEGEGETERDRGAETEQVTVVDTPDWLHAGLSEGDRRRDVGLCVNLSAPGPHAFLLVTPLGRSSGEERRTLETVLEIFGERALGHTMVLFTHADELTSRTLEESVHTGSRELQWLLEKCGNRYHALNNKDRGSTQVTELLEKIEELVAGNKGSAYYSTEMYQEAEPQIRQRQLQILREREEERLREKHQKELQNHLRRMEEEIQTREEKIRALEERIAELEERLREERDEGRRRELEEELRRERGERERLQREIEELREEQERERREREETHRREMEGLRQHYEEKAREEAERDRETLQQVSVSTTQFTPAGQECRSCRREIEELREAVERYRETIERQNTVIDRLTVWHQRHTGDTGE
ncbi:GTPase IMAP family member 8-like [Lepisosteus oculatus]|uniref:GTPase IMAP family member 8-like n=1 Tax=Lepisosteus oculatus TaxID=7918 RepID=UPI0035F518F4